MIEVEVHQQLRAFLRQQGEPDWPHYLTMARLVARALRLGRSALIQTVPTGSDRSHRLGYLAPLLLWPERSILVATERVQQRLLSVELPRLRQWMPTAKPIHQGDRWPESLSGRSFQGLLLATPEAWLRDRLLGETRFPDHIPTLIEGADDLEAWINQLRTVSLTPEDWESLRLACPLHSDLIRETRVQLTHAVFRHPANPYHCHRLEAEELEPLRSLLQHLEPSCLPQPWPRLQTTLGQADVLCWSDLDRDRGTQQISARSLTSAATLAPIWQRQPLVLLGEALDLAPDAAHFRQHLGLGEMTCVKFSPDRHTSQIQLYTPERLPLPNTPHYQAALLNELRRLLTLSNTVPGPAVLVVDDVPLKSRVGSILAAEFGSRVQVERTCLDENSILISGLEFWITHQDVLPAPQMLVIATLPFPTLEHPLVAGRVAYYKRQREDWFRNYLLPQCLSNLQRAIAPARESQGLVALLDTRVLHRSYGQQILSALSPAARIDYLDPQLFQS
ncbi:MAG: ATP-dependent DNA helicase [Synechococcales cyanobacterium RU_4_20]|nr:ATP-dependent DNA helicase [Synechococcales cyanobacterium RU_4_20]